MTRPLDQQVVVITGASSGIGRQTARRFAEAGARVVVAARRGELLEELAQELEDEGHVVLPVVTDVTDPAQLEALVEAAVERFEWIDTWVNNAGAAVFGPFEQIPPEDFAREIEVVLMSQINAVRAVLPVMRRQRSGTIIHVASLFGRVPLPLYSAYVTAESGLVGFTASLRQELRGSGIEVCTVLPACVDTPFFDHARGAYGLKPRPIDPVYDPDAVALAIRDCASRPRREVVVGWAARSMEMLERLVPGLWDRRMARTMEAMLDTETALTNLDALYRPTAEGSEARGGWGTTRERVRKRMGARAGLVMIGAALLALTSGLVLVRWREGG
jgi:short-subunit dehydrogenase